MKNRERRIWKLEEPIPQGEDPLDVPSESEKAKACINDIRYFYEEVCSKIFHEKERKLGKLHHFFLDFLRVEELRSLPQSCQHSPLAEYVPGCDDNGDFLERWLYFPTLASKPTVQDGPEGEVSEMYRNKFWKGLIFHLVGNGADRAALLPRGHLKSSLGTVVFPLWQIIRDPSARHIIRSQKTPLAAQFLDKIKLQFEGNEAFKELFGYLKPDSKELQWNDTAIQVRTANRRGADPTVACIGVESDATGSHCEYIHNDDVQGELNSATSEQREKIKQRIENHEYIRSRDSKQYHIGTCWGDGDVHSMYSRPAGQAFGITSIMVATLRDHEENPIWPEVFTEREIKLRRTKISSDHTWFCSMYNQPISPESQSFKDAWLKYYDDPPVDLAKAHKLNIFITCDPATSVRKKSDYSSCTVQGQDEDGVSAYLLDGFRERLGPEDLPRQIVKTCAFWQTVAYAYGGSFRFGIEAVGFSTYIAPAVRNEMRKQGVYFEVEELTHNFKKKKDRIKVLAAPYAAGVRYWPKSLYRKRDGKDYDFIAELKDEYLRFSPNVDMTHEDILDALAYQEDMMRTQDGPSGPELLRPEHAPGVYLRADVEVESEKEEAQREGYRGLVAGAYSRNANVSGRITGSARGPGISTWQFRGFR